MYLRSSTVLQGKWLSSALIGDVYFLPPPSKFIIHNHDVILQYITYEVNKELLNTSRNKQNRRDMVNASNKDAEKQNQWL
jgi:hypothetical protein